MIFETNLSISDCLSILLNNNIGPIKFFQNLEKYGKNIFSYLERCAPDKIINICNENDIHIIPYHSLYYPKLLLLIPNFPPLIFAKGNIDLLKSNSVSIVGTRYASALGEYTASILSKNLSEQYAITSGVARGIDMSAHNSVSNTIGVLPCGILEGRRYFHIINNGGLLISEFFPTNKANIPSFAMRNRIIAGISEKTIVIECKKNSGTIRTALFALKYNRDLYVVPGHPLDERYSGNNYLLQNYSQVKILSNIQDKLIISKAPIEIEDYIYQSLSYHPVEQEYLSSKFKISIREIKVHLTALQLKYNNIIIFDDGKVSLTRI